MRNPNPKPRRKLHQEGIAIITRSVSEAAEEHARESCASRASWSPRCRVESGFHMQCPGQRAFQPAMPRRNRRTYSNDALPTLFRSINILNILNIFNILNSLKKLIWIKGIIWIKRIKGIKGISFRQEMPRREMLSPFPKPSELSSSSCLFARFQVVNRPSTFLHPLPTSYKRTLIDKIARQTLC
jgi:hypothetical protein